MTKKQSSIVKDGELRCADYAFPVQVGSGIWLDWLEKNKSFRFEMTLTRTFEASPTQKYETRETASFSACKERRPSGEFWYATRKINGKLRRAYIGESKRLTPFRLEEIARQLHGNPERATEPSPSKPEPQELHTCVTDNDEALRVENEGLKAEVARLEAELRAAAEDFQVQQKKMAALAAQISYFKEKAEQAQSEADRLETERVEAISQNDWLRLETAVAKGKLESVMTAVIAEVERIADDIKSDPTVTRNGKDGGSVKRAVDRMSERLLVCVTEQFGNV